MGLFFSRKPRLDQFSMTEYRMPFGLDRLTPGVDNNRYDVCLSQTFCRSAEEFISCLMEKMDMSVGEKIHTEKGMGMATRDHFKKSYQDLMRSAINRAKAQREVQVDYIARTAVATFVIREINDCFGKLVGNFRQLIQEKEISRRHSSEEPLALKASLSEILLNKKQILRNTGKIVFEYLNDVDQMHLNGIRESNFGADALLPEDLFLNPFLYAGKMDDDFMIQVYDILPGHRMEDADRYDLLLSTIQHRFMEMFSNDGADLLDYRSVPDPLSRKTDEEPLPIHGNEHWDKIVDGWIRQVDNAEMFFDFIATREECTFLTEQGEKGENLKELKEMARQQRLMLQFFYKKFHAARIIKRIYASFEIRSICPIYCPPLVPQVLLQFMVVPGSRKIIINRLKRLSKINHVPFPMAPMKRCQRRIKYLGRAKKEAYLIRFLKGFFRYHRDLQNFIMLEKAMDRIHLVTDDDHLRLSRVNNTLYEFLLSHEITTEEKPVITHTILKADIRGSTDIVHQMKAKGLNPASYFSLNMFDPIKAVISEYGAFKVFIEGDAMILGIYEREGMPEGWYSVARACGLAVEILQIIQRYNGKNQQYHLPLLEIGIGITFSHEAPTLFFDGDFEIMISPAINLADRLSGCSKDIRKGMDATKPPFNNYVFQTASDEEAAATSDDLLTRYNVNGIELHPQAFEKLSGEIRLKSIECVIPGIQSEKIRFFTGTFPTVTGRSQRIIVRQGTIPHVRKSDLDLIAMTDKTYYEVCTNPMVYDHLKKHEI
jgi:class 3 adenylate cyclase